MTYNLEITTHSGIYTKSLDDLDLYLSDFDMDACDDNCVFNTVPGFVLEKVPDATRIRLVKRVLTEKEELAKDVCKGFGHADRQDFFGWVNLAKLSKLLDGMWENVSSGGFRCNMFVPCKECKGYHQYCCCSTEPHQYVCSIHFDGYLNRIYHHGACGDDEDITNIDELDVDKFKRIVHAKHPVLFPELDYELDGPEWKKAFSEMTA